MLWVLIRTRLGKAILILPILMSEYPQHMFIWRTDKTYPSIITKDPPYLFHWMILSLLFSEFLASEGNENFWGFVNQVAELNPDQFQEGKVIYIKDPKNSDTWKIAVIILKNKQCGFTMA